MEIASLALAMTKERVFEEIRMHVLIVEDERRIATYLKRGLEEQGYAVDVA
jgi:CheY-like chemotaxis protein